MSIKARIGLVCGGQSAEHDISLLSARNVFQALDRDRYEITLIGVSRDGTWRLMPLSQDGSFPSRLSDDQPAVALLPGGKGRFLVDIGDAKSETTSFNIDVLFPILHGPFGEDGTVQGAAELAGVPYVGPGVFSSAAAMDKDTAKRLLRDAGLPIAAYVALTDRDRLPNFMDIVDKLGPTVFVKPARMGSSVGVTKASTAEEFDAAAKAAFHHDQKILVEEYVQGREIECGILQLENGELICSPPGEIEPSKQHKFYSYDAKYLDPKGASVLVPAEVASGTARLAMDRSIHAFNALGCEGMARIDFFLTPQGELLVNEVNTIPGFTNISMYPKVFEAAGIPTSQLVGHLIDFAFARAAKVGGR